VGQFEITDWIFDADLSGRNIADLLGELDRIAGAFGWFRRHRAQSA
jgi:hypothetical protein